MFDFLDPRFCCLRWNTCNSHWEQADREVSPTRWCAGSGIATATSCYKCQVCGPSCARRITALNLFKLSHAFLKSVKNWNLPQGPERGGAESPQNNLINREKIPSVLTCCSHDSAVWTEQWSTLNISSNYTGGCYGSVAKLIQRHLLTLLLWRAAETGLIEWWSRSSELV